MKKVIKLECGYEGRNFTPVETSLWIFFVFFKVGQSIIKTIIIFTSIGKLTKADTTVVGLFSVLPTLLKGLVENKYLLRKINCFNPI